jgi:sideroflexin-5
MACFVPNNIPIVVGMLTHTGTVGVLFWQWVNQSYNVALNYANRNTANELSNAKVAAAYGAAVAASCTIGLGLTKFADRATHLPPAIRPMMKIAVPYTAVASAGALNLALTRANEMQHGIDVTDEYGDVHGRSKVAGSGAVFKSAMSRVVLPAPILLLPPIIMAGLERMSIIPKSGPGKMVANVGVVTISILCALPCAIGLFPQVSEIDATELEPHFHSLVDKNNNRITKFYYNKGL